MNERTGEIIPITSKRKREAGRFLREAILLIPRFVLLLYRLLRDPRVSRADKILVGAVLAYVANPLDLIPDFVPLAGQVDDLFAVSLVLMRLIADSGENVIREHWDRLRGRGPVDSQGCRLQQDFPAGSRGPRRLR